MLNLLKNTIVVIMRNIYISLIRVPISIFYIVYNFRNKYTHYVVVCNHIGDTLLTLGYLKAYIGKNKIEHTTFVTTKEMASLVKYYKQTPDYVMIIREKHLRLILDSGKTNFGSHVIKRIKNITIINPENAFVDEFFLYPARFPMLSLKNCIKYGELGLEENEVFNVPIYKDTNSPEVLRDMNVKKGCTIILAPYASVTKQLPFSFFDMISRFFSNNGYDVLTNITNSNQRIAECSLPLCCDISDILVVAEYCGWVIGIRSGLMDLLCYARCHIIVLYPSDNPYMNFFSLTALEDVSADVLEYCFENEENDFTYIMNYVEQRRKV